MVLDARFGENILTCFSCSWQDEIHLFKCDAEKYKVVEVAVAEEEVPTERNTQGK